MKFTVSTKEMHAALKTALRAVPVRIYAQRL